MNNWSSLNDSKDKIFIDDYWSKKLEKWKKKSITLLIYLKNYLEESVIFIDLLKNLEKINEKDSIIVKKEKLLNFYDYIESNNVYQEINQIIEDKIIRIETLKQQHLDRLKSQISNNTELKNSYSEFLCNPLYRYQDFKDKIFEYYKNDKDFRFDGYFDDYELMVLLENAYDCFKDIEFFKTKIVDFLKEFETANNEFYDYWQSEKEIDNNSLEIIKLIEEYRYKQNEFLKLTFPKIRMLLIEIYNKNGKNSERDFAKKINSQVEHIENEPFKKYLHGLKIPLLYLYLVYDLYIVQQKKDLKEYWDLLLTCLKKEYFIKYFRVKQEIKGKPTKMITIEMLKLIKQKLKENPSLTISGIYKNKNNGLQNKISYSYLNEWLNNFIDFYANKNMIKKQKIRDFFCKISEEDLETLYAEFTKPIVMQHRWIKVDDKKYKRLFNI